MERAGYPQASEGWCSISNRFQRGQITIELAIQIPLLMLLMFGAVRIAQVFYTYHILQQAVRGGAGALARGGNVNYCDLNDAAFQDTRNLIVYGNLQGSGVPVVPGFTTDMIEILPERQLPGETTVTACPCAEDDPDGCDPAAGGRVPDFVVVKFVDGFPMLMSFPFVNLAPINLRVSVRMPVTGS